jgi:alkaline phosphatase D
MKDKVFRRNWGLIVGLACYSIAGLAAASDSSLIIASTHQGVEYRVGLGSCLRQDLDMPVWSAVHDRQPDTFIFMGDNVYADIGPYKRMDPPDNFDAAYQTLANQSEFSAFRAAMDERGIPLLATWDDHDYGLNDGGADYPHKLAAKRAFLEFFNTVTPAVTSLDEPGIYSSKTVVTGNGLVVQFIVLDTRSFRSSMEKRKNNELCQRGGWEFMTEADATVLGETQWQWLQGELTKPADVRLLVSSIQVLPTQQCFEKWSNFPQERERLFSLIQQTKANGVVLVSGDRHLSEISVLEREDFSYPLYELTSSGLNSALKGRFNSDDEPNNLRALPNNITVDSFGEIDIVGQAPEFELVLRLLSESGDILQVLTIPADQLAVSP